MKISRICLTKEVFALNASSYCINCQSSASFLSCWTCVRHRKRYTEAAIYEISHGAEQSSSKQQAFFYENYNFSSDPEHVDIYHDTLEYLLYIIYLFEVVETFLNS
jgi:hypothetical protein